MCATVSSLHEEVNPTHKVVLYADRNSSEDVDDKQAENMCHVHNKPLILYDKECDKLCCECAI